MRPGGEEVDRLRGGYKAVMVLRDRDREMAFDNGCKVIRAEEVASFSFGGALCASSVSNAKISRIKRSLDVAMYLIDMQDRQLDEAPQIACRLVSKRCRGG